MKLAQQLMGPPGRLLRRIKKEWRRRTGADSFLTKSRGVIHIGANEGQERDEYEYFGLPVLWVEAIPSVFEQLQKHLRAHEKQRAALHAVSDSDGETVEFHVSNNNALSSSLLPLQGHKEMWPDVNYVETLRVKTITLPTLLETENALGEEFDTLVMDVQGAEGRILSGAQQILPRFRFVKLEAADFAIYEGASTRCELETMLKTSGFRVRHVDRFAHKDGLGSCYNIVFERFE